MRRRLVTGCSAALWVLVASGAYAAPSVEECTSLRIPGKCKPAKDSTRVEHDRGEMTVTTTVTLPQQTLQQADACEAAVSISYAQMYDRIRVDAKIAGEDCARSEGEYVLRARTVSDAGDVDTREFVELWQRSTTAPLEQRHEYPMDGEARLMWVTVSTRPKSACRCLEP